MSKNFYIETFGCQMNAHDSEKVVGTLENEGYAQVTDEAAADLILYNTCSIRDKAEQKVFHRLNEYKRMQGEGKKFAVLGCVAQQEGAKIFERAPYVSMVAGSASYRNLPEMLARMERGETRITGLDDRGTDETFDTEFTSRSNPHRGYITIIEGCDKFCAYCVVPYTRGKERSRTSASVLAEAGRIAALGYTEVQLLGQNVNSYVDPSGRRTFAELLIAVGEVPGIQRVRFTTSHPRQFTRDIIEAIDAYPQLCNHVHLPVQSGSSATLRAMAREYTREWYLERIAWMHAAARDISVTSDIIVGFPGETERDFEDTITLLNEVIRRDLRLQILPASQHPGHQHGRLHSRRGKDRAARHPQRPPTRDPARTLRPAPRRGHAGHGRRPQHGARTGHRPLHPEQDRELHLCDDSRHRQLHRRSRHADLSQLAGGGGSRRSLSPLCGVAGASGAQRPFSLGGLSLAVAGSSRGYPGETSHPEVAVPFYRKREAEPQATCEASLEEVGTPGELAE